MSFLLERQKNGDLVGYNHEDGTSLYGLVKEISTDFTTGIFYVVFLEPNTMKETKIYMKVEQMRNEP